MPRFYNISTTDFRPISFENVYLYGEYKKIKNFLVSNNQQELLKVLAIPSYKNNNIVWSANTNNEIKKLEQYSKTQQNKILSEYNEFLNSYNNFVHNLRSSKNQDNKNWGELLFSLIEGTANELFFDGENIFITWGWRLLDENSKKLIPVFSPPSPKSGDINPVIEEVIDEPESIPIIDEDEEILSKKENKLSWLDKLYLFLKKLWWLIPMLSIIILILILLKTCENNKCDTDCCDTDYTDLVPCNTDTKSGGDGTTTTKHSLGKYKGTVTIDYNMFNEPDKLEIIYEGKIVSSTLDIPRHNNGFVGNNNAAGCCNSLSFYYPATGDIYCTIVVTGGNGTQWNYTLRCPK
mgnify:CR=1 FL=1